MTDLLTYEQAAARVGVSVQTLRRRAIAGEIPFAKGGGRGSTAYFCPAVCDAARETEEARRRERFYILSTETETHKPCAKCREMLPRTAFRKNVSMRGGLAHYCKECEEKDRRRRIKADTEHYREVWKRAYQRYKMKHGETIRNRHNARRWANLEASRQSEREHNRRTWAIADGKASPICRRHGFSLVRDRDGQWRAARLDKPLNPGEVAYAHFEWGMREPGRWHVSAPPLRVPSKRILTNLQRKEQETANK